MNLKDYLSSVDCEKGLTSIILDLAIAGHGVLKALSSSEVGKKLESHNESGETQMALDVISNDIITNILEKNENVSVVGSEELEALPVFRDSGYAVVYDPLDGSSLLDVNLSIGTIVGIYPTSQVLSCTGDDQVASLIIVYGPRLTMMLTVKKGTHEFTFNDGEWILTNSDLKLDSNKKMYAPGNLRAVSSNLKYRDVVNYWLDNQYQLRYSGGMVPDINQILIKGCGVFTYPGYDKAPNGKLRLVFECAPMALLVEQAGGIASDGNIRILDKIIKEVHQRTPIFIGKTDEVEKVLKIMN